MIERPLYDGVDLEVLAEMPNYYGWIMQIFQEHLCGKAIEFGAGSGSISSRLLPSVDELELVEPSANLVRLLRFRFGNLQTVKISPKTLEQRIAEPLAGLHQTVVAVNLLEHIKDDLEALNGFWRLLAPGGKLCLFVPALPMLMSALDRKFGHFRRYSLNPLTDMLANAGFLVIRAEYFDFLGLIPWLIVNRWGGVVNFNSAAVKVYDSVGVPVTKALESLISPRIGKNIIVIAEKPRS